MASIKYKKFIIILICILGRINLQLFVHLVLQLLVLNHYSNWDPNPCCIFVLHNISNNDILLYIYLYFYIIIDSLKRRVYEEFIKIKVFLIL